ncbi:MAG: GtrA family protein [Gammaproteobacteria bacterium]|nr:GtrA family protein [Gammaproteobacteria bacterium]
MRTFSATILEHSFPRYVLVGSIGFIIDAGLLAVLHYGVGWEVMASRFCSFAVAVTATWLLNRVITFADSRSHRLLAEWFRYTVVNVLGGGLNLAVFAGVMHLANSNIAQPMTAIVFSSLVALAFTYSANRWLVFAATEERE